MWSSRSLRLRTCRDGWDSPGAFRRLMVIHRMAVVVVRCRKFGNGPLVQLLVILTYRLMTNSVASRFIAESHALRNQLKLRNQRW